MTTTASCENAEKYAYAKPLEPLLVATVAARCAGSPWPSRTDLKRSTIEGTGCHDGAFELWLMTRLVAIHHGPVPALADFHIGNAVEVKIQERLSFCKRLKRK